MKILFVSKSQIPSNTANSINVMKMCEAFSSLSHYVQFIAPNQLKIENDNIEEAFEYYGVKSRFDIHRIEKINKNTKPSISVKDIIKTRAGEMKADVVYARCNSIQFGLHAINIPVIVEIHKIIDEEDSLLLNELINRGLLRRIIVINNYLKSYYMSKYNLLEDDVLVAHSGADEIPDEQRVCSIENSELNVGYAGHLYKGKGMEIITELATKLPWARFHIVGGTLSDLEYWQKKMIKNIHFHGYVRHSEVYKYLNSCDVLLAPYKHEIGSAGGGTLSSDWISPLKIFEYMSAGKAIIATSLPSIKEVLRDKENAILCSPDMLQDWVDALNFLHANPEKSIELGNNAKLDFIKNYSWRSRAQQVLNGLAI